MRLSVRILIAITLLMLLTGSVSLLLSSRLINYVLDHEDREWSATLMETLTEGLAYDTVNRNALHATETLNNIALKNTELRYAYVVDFDGRIFAHTFEEGFPKKILEQLGQQSGDTRLYSLDGRLIKELSAPVIEGMDASLHLGLDKELDEAFIKGVQRNIIYLFGAVTLFGILLSYLLAKQVARPLEVITSRVEDYGQAGRWTNLALKFNDFEVGRLANAFDSMIHAKEQSIAEVNQFKTTLDKTLDCVFMFNEDDLKFFYVNQGAIDQIGYSYDEMLNMTPVDIKPNYTENEFRDIIKPLISGQQKSLTFETIHQHRNGDQIPVEIFLQYLKDDFEKPRFVAIVRDISERKKKDAEIQALNTELEERIRQRTKELEDSLEQVKTEVHERRRIEIMLRSAKEEAEKANMLKSQFLGRMSHELRTPMNAIMGFGQLLEAEGLNTEQQDFLSEMMSASRHLLTLIDEVLDLAKIESGKIELNTENIPLEQIVAESVAMVASMARMKNITIENFVEDKNIYIKADKARIKEVMINLLSNAIKYNSDNGRVTINAKQNNPHMIRLQVTDTGKGISEEQQQLLFEPFNRLGAEYSDIEGTGIGLTIANQLLNLMGGKLGLESELGIGSTFWADCPTALIDAEVDDLSSSTNKTQMDVQKMLILYVEDNPANLRLVEKALKKVDGLSLLSSPTAELGIELAREKSPDLIIMDINLPGMDGYEALSRLRNYRETQNIPVIALSAAAMPRDVERGLLAGFKRYLTKPIQIDDLRSAIEHFSAQKAKAAIKN